MKVMECKIVPLVIERDQKKKWKKVISSEWEGGHLEIWGGVTLRRWRSEA